MQKRITAVSKTLHGHAILEFEDGSKQTVFRHDHDAHRPEIGEMWPPRGHEHETGVVQNGSLRPIGE